MPMRICISVCMHVCVHITTGNNEATYLGHKYNCTTMLSELYTVYERSHQITKAECSQPDMYRPRA